MDLRYKELKDKAFECHQKGDYETASTIYKSLLKINPDDSNILNLMGLLSLATNDVTSAIDCLTKAFIINHAPSIANNLAKAYYMANEPQKAVKLYLEALKLEISDDTYYSLGLAYKKLGNLQSAIEAYRNALEQNPGNYSACYNLALAYSDSDDIENALYYAEKCAIMKDDDESLFAILSGLYEKQNDYEAAVKALEKAASLNPNNFLYYYNMAVLNSYINQDDKAVSCYLNAIEINPNHIESYVNIANIVKKQNPEKAVEYLLKAYELNPKEEKLLLSLAQAYKDIYKYDDSILTLKELLSSNPLCDEAYSLTAMNYMDLCEYEKAFEYYNLALKVNPQNLNFIHGKAVALKYLGNPDECRSLLESIVNNENASLETKITLGMMYLQDKEFEKGMMLYRLRANNIKSVHIQKDSMWEPYDNIENKTVLVYSNCGLGDSIMYARYLPYLEKKAKEVILQTDKELVSILQESFPMINVMKKSEKPPKYDTVLQFMDIQLATGMDFSIIPFSEGYLKANDDLVKMFSKLPVFDTTKKKIGLFWQGNKRIFKNRSIKFDTIKRLTENKNFNFYSFQIDLKFEETDNFFDLSPHIKDYSDTAALLKNIDLLITIDSSIAHMAGALGVPTFLLLPETAEWRWFYDTETTPWYNSVKIFKQTESCNWDEVIERVENEL